MEWLRDKLRKWLGISRNLELIRYSEQSIHQLEDTLKERTEYHLDVHQYQGSQVIIIGKYRNRDYVNIYDIQDEDLRDVIDHCKSLNRYAKRGRVDSYPMINTVFDREGL